MIIHYHKNSKNIEERPKHLNNNISKNKLLEWKET